MLILSFFDFRFLIRRKSVLFRLMKPVYHIFAFYARWSVFDFCGKVHFPADVAKGEGTCEIFTSAVDMANHISRPFAPGNRQSSPATRPQSRGFLTHVRLQDQPGTPYASTNSTIYIAKRQLISPRKRGLSPFGSSLRCPRQVQGPRTSRSGERASRPFSVGENGRDARSPDGRPSPRLPSFSLRNLFK